MSDRKRLEAAATAAAKGAAAAAGARVAVVVVVRELPDGALAVGSNIVSDRAALLRVLKEGTDAVRGDGLIIV